MHAMILAAGHGERMLNLTHDKPKSLLEISGKPLIIYQIAVSYTHLTLPTNREV